MNLETPAYAIGQVVRVFTYYNDMIVRGSFNAVIVGINTHHAGHPHTTHHIYEVLSSDSSPIMQTAEEFAIRPINEE